MHYEWASRNTLVRSQHDARSPYELRKASGSEADRSQASSSSEGGTIRAPKNKETYLPMSSEARCKATLQRTLSITTTAVHPDSPSAHVFATGRACLHEDLAA